MTSPSGAVPLVGFSTGALTRGRVDDGVRRAAAVTAPEGSLIELSALHGDELDSVLAARVAPAVSRFARVSVHAPIKGPVPDADQFVATLAGLGCGVVCHPDAVVAHSGGNLAVFTGLGP